MRRSVILPARSFTWAWGRPAGGGLVPAPGFGFAFENPIGPDRFRHALKTHTEAPQYGSRNGKVARKGSSQTLLDDEKITRLTGRSCGGFPGIGRTLPSRHFLSQVAECLCRVSFRGSVARFLNRNLFWRRNEISHSSCFSDPAVGGRRRCGPTSPGFIIRRLTAIRTRDCSRSSSASRPRSKRWLGARRPNCRAAACAPRSRPPALRQPAGTHMVIADGRVLTQSRASQKEEECTWFLTPSNPIAARELWIGGSLELKGAVFVGAGAAAELVLGKSLLPAGVTRVEGVFARGDCVAIRDERGAEIGRGLIAYDALHAERIRGRNSRDIAHILGTAGRAEMIHRDDMALSGPEPRRCRRVGPPPLAGRCPPRISPNMGPLVDRRTRLIFVPRPALIALATVRARLRASDSA